MTKQEQATLDELRMTEAELEARQAKVSQLLNGEATLGDQLKASIALVDANPLQHIGKMITIGTCPECHKPAEFWDRNRLANCGHVRRSHGKLIPRDEKPEQPKPTQPGCISSVQAARLRDLIDTKQSRLAELDAINDQQAHALGAVDAATAELDAYLRELQGKKTP